MFQSNSEKFIVTQSPAFKKFSYSSPVKYTFIRHVAFCSSKLANISDYDKLSSTKIIREIKNNNYLHLINLQKNKDFYLIFQMKNKFKFDHYHKQCYFFIFTIEVQDETK